MIAGAKRLAKQAEACGPANLPSLPEAPKVSIPSQVWVIGAYESGGNWLSQGYFYSSFDQAEQARKVKYPNCPWMKVISLTLAGG